MAYTVTVASTAGGSVTGGGTYEQDQRFTLIATAADGYVFLKWVRGASSIHLSYNATYTPPSNSTLINRDETYRAIFVKIVAEHGSVSMSSSTYTVTPDVGFLLTSLVASSGGEYMTISGGSVTVKNSAPQGADLVATANFRKKNTDDGYYIYIRWKSQYSTAEGGAEVDRELRIIKGNVPTASKPTSATLRKWISTGTGALSSIVSTTGEAPKIKTIYNSDGTAVSYYSANYLPLADDGNYWEGRNVGAKRSNGDVLTGWELRASGSGDPIATLPADGSTTIRELSEMFDEADVGFGNNSDGDYRVAFLTAVFGSQHGVSVSSTGTQGEAADVSASPASALAGATVTLTAQTDNLATCEFYGWSATAGGNPVSTTDVSPGVATFTMPDADVTAVAEYEPKQFALSVADGGGGTASCVKRGTNEPPTSEECVYGLELTLKAVADQGFSFSGWYLNGSSTPASASANYDVTLTGDLAAVAKFNAPILFSVSAGSNSGGYISVDGEDHATETSFTVQREVGSTVSLRAVTTSGHFVGWKKNGSSVELQAECSITVAESASTAYTAVFSENAPQFIVGISNVDDDASGGTASSPGYVVLSGQNVEELSTADRSIYAPQFSDCDAVYRVTGTEPVVYTVYRTGDKGFKRLAWEAMSPTSSGGASLLDTDPPVATQNSVEVMSGAQAFYEDGVWTSHWGNVTSTTINAESDNAANGTVAVFGGTDAAGDGASASAKFMPGDSVTLSAAPANGYTFGGWYYNGTKVSELATFAFEFGSSTGADHPYVAHFEPDTDAIFEWEGSTDNKQMEWRSKVYVAPKPFDPVAARVDATGHDPAVLLDVGTMSSPNVEPTRPHAISIGSQDGRRLPRMRPERFVRFEVKSTHEIDAVVIGTNMAEVN